MVHLPFEDVKNKVVLKRESETNSCLGCDPEKRAVRELIRYGVINLNKPSGPTSHQAVDYIKKILNLKKAGHSGTLDPKVTGVLPIALDRATRIVQVLLSTGKEYICLMHLHKEVPETEVRKAFEKFSGEIKQIPPVRSAVKRVERTRKIYYVELMEIDSKDVLFKIGCQAGTYIRKFAHQIGEHLGVGAHMSGLVRTRVGPFSDKNMFTLHDLKDAYEFFRDGDEKEIRKIVVPFERATDHLKKVWITDGAVDPLCHGADLYIAGVVRLYDTIQKNDLVAIFTLKNELICIGNAATDAHDILKNDKGTAVTTTKVFMERGTYATH